MTADVLDDNVDSLAAIPIDRWDSLSAGQPCLRHAFLHALHESGCASGRTGWSPRFMVVRRDDRVVGALPLYEKTHSLGEFVFDWAWADAHARAGIAYYPKLLTAVPLTPIEGSRFLASEAGTQERLLDAAVERAARSGLSSWHVLFPTTAEAQMLAARGLLLRRGVQFHWVNRGYRDFEDFLDGFTREKRKKIRQERRRVRDAGVTLRRLSGAEISRGDWAFFHECYVRTYAERGRQAYLNAEFFLRIAETMPENLVLVLAERGGRPVASALNLRDSGRMYGRYWGAIEYVPCLHFETCFYQGIEHCIAERLDVFEGGAQGEHKLARGFEPAVSISAHWIRDWRFRDALSAHLAREAAAVDRYVSDLRNHLPFRNPPQG